MEFPVNSKEKRPESSKYCRKKKPVKESED